MNHRIRELYLQAHSIRYHDGDPALDGNPPTVYWQGEVSAQRFAELIVRECIDQISVNHDPTSDWDYEVSRGNAIAIIKEHFGVEE